MFSESDHSEDTICAIATGGGVGGIAVLRISGSNAAEIVGRLCPFFRTPESHRIYHGTLRSLDTQEPLDDVLVSYFAQGKSYTGEETVEVSCHGGTVISSLVLNEIISAGARLAKPGEFTFRAFWNDRLDLVQAESVLGLIESQSKNSARAALRQLQGHLSKEFGKIEDDLVWVLAQLEAEIDFSEEGLDTAEKARLLERTRGLRDHVAGLVKSYSQGRILRDGLKVVLVGRPNVGKSSLLNAFLEEDRAIVTEQAGTTRDLVEGRREIEGLPVLFVDTAGLRESSDQVEKIGIERARKAMVDADVIFAIEDASVDMASELAQIAKANDVGKTYFIFNKADLPEAALRIENLKKEAAKQGVLDRYFWVSARTGQGIESVFKLLSGIAKQNTGASMGVLTQARHFESMQKIQTKLALAIGLIESGSSPEFVAFELQESVRLIHELLGKEFHEQVIDRIFKEFCLGK